ncbi:MAG TPA: sodium:solute symporter family protein, partial [Candidatus Blautia avistercoris]|nr:sodium:solute symporter family protein [Candidatus Blautia avistercoris]
AITLAAVQIGVGIVLSGATNGYNGGVWYGIYYSIGCGGGLILAGLLTTKKLRAQEGYVPLDFFAQRYGESRGVRFWAWLSNVPSLLGIFIAQLLACGSILAGFGVPYRLAVVITAVVILIYCTIGGMWGVVLTDVIQTGIIMIGIPILAIATLIQYVHAGGSIADIYATPFIPKGRFTEFIYLVLPFFLSISVSYDAYARIQSAKDVKTATRGCIGGGIIVIVIGLLCSTIGAACVKLFPGVTDGIFTIATTNVLPPVLAGVVIAAILSAAMSSANCVILSLGASFSRDLYNKFLHPEVENLDELPKSKVISQAAVFGGSIAGILFAFYMSDILDAMIIFNYPYMGSLLVPLLGGLLWKGATRKGAFAAAIAGGIVGVGAFLIGIPSPIQGILNVDLALMIAYLVSAVVLVTVSVNDKNGKKVRS